MIGPGMLSIYFYLRHLFFSSHTPSINRHMWKQLQASFARKKARRVTREYPPVVDTYDMGRHGQIEFANWSNPLAPRITLNASVVDFFGQFIKEGDLAIDIGANIGDTTVPMALCTGTTGVTLGFDPNPYVFKILEKNASLNAGKYVIHPQNYAISTHDQEYFFISSEASYANGGISPTAESRHGRFVHPQKVRGVQLKSFLERHYADRMSRLSFIKVDTEGYDKEIIKSIGDLLQACKPVLVAESFGKASDAAKAELFDVIAVNGYDIWYFEDFDINAKVEKMETASDLVKFRHTVNVFARPKA